MLELVIFPTVVDLEYFIPIYDLYLLLCYNPDSPEEVYIRTVDRHVNNVRRMLVEQMSNLEATPPTNGAPSPSISPSALPSRSSGSFPAVPNWKEPVSAPAPSPTPPDHSTTNTGAISRTTDNRSSTNGKSEHSVNVVVIISAVVFFAVLAIILLLIFKRRMAKNIVPWKKSELSGQLQNALITGTLLASLPVICIRYFNYHGLLT